MILAIRAELLKLRTARLPWSLLAVTVGLASLQKVLFDSNAGGTGHASIPSLATIAGQNKAVLIPQEVLFLASILGVIVASGEFRHKTATATYLAVPDRRRVLAAKAGAASALGLLFGLAGAAATTTIGLSFITGGSHPVLLSTATIARYAAGATLGAGLLAAAGVALGSIVRSQVGAIIAVFIWGFVVEQAVGGLYGSVERYLPYTAAASLAGLRGDNTPLPFAAVAVLLAVLAAVVSLIAARTTVNADVT